MHAVRFPRLSNNRRESEGELDGKESQEGREESPQEGQVNPGLFPIFVFKDAAALRGVFFCMKGASTLALRVAERPILCAGILLS